MCDYTITDMKTLKQLRHNEASRRYYEKNRARISKINTERVINSEECLHQHNINARFTYYNKKGMMSQIDIEDGKRIVQYMIENNLKIGEFEIVKNMLISSN